MGLKLLKEPPAGLSPARQRLAEAIKLRDDLDAGYQSLHAAASWSGHAVQAVTRADERLEEARGAIEAAKAASVESLVSGAAGATDGIREARLAYQCAVDDLEAATTARDTLKARLAEAESRREFWNTPVRNAALAVMAAETDIGALLTTMEHLQREMTRVGMAMEWLRGADIIKRNTEPLGQVVPMGLVRGCADPRMQTAISRYNCPPNTWNELLKIPDLRGDVRWAEALTALMLDAAAALPSG